jgi:peptidoglycan/xylan/chitin deacetylase (PgdA/CDA1 family)
VRALPVLLYHSISDDASSEVARFTISPKVFDEHMRHLAEEGYSSMTVTEFLPALLAPGSPDPPGDVLPERPVVVTFDDGFRDFLTSALPIMQRHGIRSTLYATTGFMGEGETPGTNRSGDEMLSWGELAEVSRQGVEVGGHTHSHPMLDTLPHAAASDEITRCKALIEQHAGAAVASFAYPHGYSSAWIRRVVAGAGYTSACAVKNAMSHTGDDRFAIARLMLEVSHTRGDFLRMLSGDGFPVASPHDRWKTRGWRLARRGLALGHRLRARSLP